MYRTTNVKKKNEGKEECLIWNILKESKCWGTKLASTNLRSMIEIIPSIFSNHNSLKLEISFKEKAGKTTNMCRLNNMLLTNTGSKK